MVDVRGLDARSVCADFAYPAASAVAAACVDTMSDGISRIELKKNTYGTRYHSDEGEDRGLLRTAPDPASRNPAQLDVDDNETETVAASGAVNKSYENNDLLPVMIENGLERIGVL